MKRNQGSLLLFLILAAPLAAQPGNDRKPAWDLFRERDYERALEAFKKEDRLYPRTAALMDGMGWCEFFLGRYAEAEKHFNEALACDPDYKWSKEGLQGLAAVRKAPLEDAAALLAAGRYAEARAQYQRILEGKTAADRSAHADACSGEGWCLYSLGNYAEALKSFRRALKEQPNHADAYRGIGSCESARGSWVDAIVALRMSLKLEPTHYLGRLTLGWCFYWKKDYREALREFEQAARMVDGAWGALVGIGWCHERLGDPSKARAAFESAVSVSPYALDFQLRALVETRPSWWGLLVAAGWSALRAHLDARALEEFRAALQHLPGDGDALRGSAFVLFRLGDYQGALQAAATAAASEPGLPPIRLPILLQGGKEQEIATDLETLRGWCLYRLGRYDDALAAFRRVLSPMPTRAEARCGEGWALHSLGNYLAADVAFREASSLLPGYADASAGSAAIAAWRFAEYDTAWGLLQAGRADEALRAFRGLLERSDGRFPKERSDLLEASTGWAEAALGNTSAARDAFGRALALSPDLGLAHKGLGFLHRRQGDAAEAVVRFRKALLDPAFAHDPETLMALAGAEREAHRPDRAEEALLRILERDPRNAAASATLGWTYLALRKPVEARLTFERALALDPSVVEEADLRAAMEKEPELAKLCGSLGWAWLRHGACDRALRAFDEAAKRDPRNREAQRGRGLALLRLGELKTGSETLKTYFAAAPSKENPWGILSATLSEWGWTLYFGAQYAEAIKVFGKLGALHAGEKEVYADPHDGLGWCYLRQGRMEPARKEFLQAIAISPRHESSLQGLETLNQWEARQ